MKEEEDEDIESRDGGEERTEEGKNKEEGGPARAERSEEMRESEK